MTEQFLTPLQRLVDLLEEEYPDPAPPKEWKSSLWLYETLDESQLDNLRRELTSDEADH